MKSFTGKFSSARGWALLLALFLGAGMFAAACGDEEAPAPTTPTPTPPPPDPAPPPPPEPTGPGVPANLKVTDTTSSTITWSWDAVEGAIGYQGQFSPDAEFTESDPTYLVIAPATSYKVENLKSNTKGYFRVRSGAGTAVTDLTYSDWAEAVSGETGDPPPATALSTPTGVSAGTREDDSIVVTWDEVEDAETYEVEQRVAGGDWTDASCGAGDDNFVETTQCTATGLTAGTDYEFRVRAVPATDSDKYKASAWSDALPAKTGGFAPSDPVSGGMGDLNVRWQNNGDNNANILFIWDQGDDTTTYETADLETYSHATDPCPTTGWVDRGSATSRTRENLSAPGSVRGLCVRVKGSSDTSFAWGINPPEEPDVGTPVLDKNKTTELEWSDVDVKKEFDYEIRVASDPLLPERDNKIGSTTVTTAKVVQSACDAGIVINEYTPDTDRNGLTETLDRGLTPNTGYLLCVRASNSAGTTPWSVPTTNDDADTYNTGVVRETFTRPDAPPTPKFTGAKSTAATTGANEKLAPAWEIRTRDAHEVPRDVADYTLSVFYSNAASAKSPGVAACGTTPDGYTTIDENSLTLKDEIDVFTVAVNDGVEREGYSRKMYLCAQADNGDDNGLGVGPWTISSVYTVSKPSGLSGSIKFVSTKNSNDDPVTYSIAVTIGITKWNKSWSYSVKEGTEDASCTSGQTGASVDVDWDSLALSTSREVKVFASDACADGTLLTTATHKVPSS